MWLCSTLLVQSTSCLSTLRQLKWHKPRAPARQGCNEAYASCFLCRLRENVSPVMSVPVMSETLRERSPRIGLRMMLASSFGLLNSVKMQSQSVLTCLLYGVATRTSRVVCGDAAGLAIDLHVRLSLDHGAKIARASRRPQ